MGLLDSFFDKLDEILKTHLYGYKKLENGDWLEIRGENEAYIVEKEEIPQKILKQEKEEEDEELDEIKHNQKYDLNSLDEKRHAKSMRSQVIDGESPKEIASRVPDNHYILHDILNDPSLVEADSRADAVEFIAEAEPAWAEITDLHSIDPDVDAEGKGINSDGETDTKVETSSEASETIDGEASGDTGTGSSTSVDTGRPSVDAGNVGESSGVGNGSSVGNNGGVGDSGGVGE